MLWLDANEPNATSSIWLDQSGNKNHAKKYDSPKTMPHPASGLMVMSYDSKKNDYHEFKEINNIRTVFWVMSKKGGNSGSPLAHATTHHFYSDGSKFWHPQHTHEHIRSGSLRLNGLAGSSHSNYPSSLGIVSLRTTGNVTASRLGKDRNHGGKYNWDGEIGELLIFSEPLTDEHIQKIENHLITKWKIKKKTEIRYGAPVAYLSFDERKGNSYPNSATPSKAANTNGNNKEVTGKRGKGIHFTGDDALNFPSGFGDFNRHQSFSMAFWIQPTQYLDR